MEFTAVHMVMESNLLRFGFRLEFFDYNNKIPARGELCLPNKISPNTKLEITEEEFWSCEWIDNWYNKIFFMQIGKVIVYKKVLYPRSRVDIFVVIVYSEINAFLIQNIDNLI